jgi:WD40 repeat protein
MGKYLADKGCVRIQTMATSESRKSPIARLGVAVAIALTLIASQSAIVWLFGISLALFLLIFVAMTTAGISYDIVRHGRGILGGTIGGLIVGLIGSIYLEVFDPVSRAFRTNIYGTLVVSATVFGGFVGSMIWIGRRSTFQDKSDSASATSINSHWLEIIAVALTVGVALFFLAVIAGELLYLDVRASKKPNIRLTLHTGAVTSICWAPGGRSVVTAGEDGIVRSVDYSGKALWRQGPYHYLTYCVRYSPDGQLLACGTSIGDVVLRDPRLGREIARLTGHAAAVRDLAFSSDGTRLVSVSGSITGPGEVKVWNVESRLSLATYTSRTNLLIEAVTVSPDGHFIAIPEGETVAVLDGLHLSRLHTLQGHPQSVHSVEFSPDGTRLATADGRGDTAAVIKLWCTGNWRDICTLVGHGKDCRQIRFSSDGDILASVSIPDCAVWLWNIDSQERQMILKGSRVPLTCTAFCPVGEMCAAGDMRGTVLFWLWDE